MQALQARRVGKEVEGGDEEVRKDKSDKTL